MAQTTQAKEKTMRAVAIDRFGGPETLKVETLPETSERPLGLATSGELIVELASSTSPA